MLFSVNYSNQKLRKSHLVVFENKVCLKKRVWDVEDVTRDRKQRVAFEHVAADHVVHQDVH